MTKAPKKRRKKADQLTTAEAVKRLFPPRLRKALKKIVRQLDNSEKRKRVS